MSDTDFENNTPLCNYQALAMYLIYTAVRDIANRDKARRAADSKNAANAALAWLNGGAAMFPCKLACEIIGVDLEALHQRISIAGALKLYKNKLYMLDYIKVDSLSKLADSMQRASMRIIDHRGQATNEKIEEYDNDCI